MVYAHISIRPAFQRSPSEGTSKEDPGAAFCCVLLTLFGSTASSTTVNALIVMRQYMESLFVTLSYLLYHQFCEKRTLQSCKCYKGTLVLRITPGHWIIWQIICGYSKTEHRILIGNIMIFKIILSNYEVTLEKCSNGHAI